MTHRESYSVTIPKCQREDYDLQKHQADLSRTYKSNVTHVRHYFMICCSRRTDPPIDMSLKKDYGSYYRPRKPFEIFWPICEKLFYVVSFLVSCVTLIEVLSKRGCEDPPFFVGYLQQWWLCGRFNFIITPAVVRWPVWIFAVGLLFPDDPCEFGDPVEDQKGEQLDCGLAGKPCPDGSSCVTDPLDRFSVCCPKGWCKNNLFFQSLSSFEITDLQTVSFVIIVVQTPPHSCFVFNVLDCAIFDLNTAVPGLHNRERTEWT